MIKKLSILILLLLIIYYSCKKEPLDQKPIHVPTYTLLLSKVYANDSLFCEYTYDSGFVVKEQGSDGTIPFNYNNHLLESESFFGYNLFCLYNPKGQLIQTKFTTDQTADIVYSDFVYDSLNIKEVISFNTTELGYIKYTYDGHGNISQESLYQFPNVLTEKVTYTYDDKHNPYESLSTMPGTGTNANNVIKEVRTLLDTTLVTTNTYEYNSYDFPSTKNGNIIFTYKIIQK